MAIFAIVPRCTCSGADTCICGNGVSLATRIVGSIRPDGQRQFLLLPQVLVAAMVSYRYIAFGIWRWTVVGFANRSFERKSAGPSSFTRNCGLDCSAMILTPPFAYTCDSIPTTEWPCAVFHSKLRTNVIGTQQLLNQLVHRLLLFPPGDPADSR